MRVQLKIFNSRRFVLLILGLTLMSLFTLALACAGTATPAAPAPAPYVAPTAVAPTAVPAPVLKTHPTAVPTAVGTKVQKGGTLRHSVALAFKTMDPFFRTGYREQMVVFALYDSLVQYGPNLDVMPDLAESWEFSDGGKVITFKLRQGVKFHDGSDFNAQAVMYNWSQMMDPEYGAVRARNTVGPGVTNWEAIDDNTFKVTMKAPWRPFLASLSQAEFRIRSPKALEERGVDNFQINPSGTGAFEFGEWIPDNRLILNANKNYFVADRPHVDAIRFQHVPDHTVQLAMVRTGETDLVDDVKGYEVPLIEGSPKSKVSPYDSGRWRGASFDHDKEPWSNKAVRQAIAHALDREKIVASLLEGYGTPTHQAANVGWWSDPTLQVYEYSPAKAKAKLAEAGYADGLTFPFWCQADNFGIQQCEVYQALLSEVGITFDIQLVPPSDFWGDISADKMNAWPDWSFPRGDADPDLRRRLHSEGNFQVVGYSNPKMDALFEKAASEFDIPKARNMYLEIQQMATEDIVNLPLWREQLFAGLSNEVQNWVFWGDTLLRFRDVWLEQ